MGICPFYVEYSLKIAKTLLQRRRTSYPKPLSINQNFKYIELLVGVLGFWGFGVLGLAFNGVLGFGFRVSWAFGWA